MKPERSISCMSARLLLRTLLAITVLSTELVHSSCALSGQEKDTALRRVNVTADELLLLDFTRNLEEIQYSTLAELESLPQESLEVFHLRTLQDYGGLRKMPSELSPGELRASGVHFIRGEQLICVDTMFSGLVAFYDEHGRLPDNGLEFCRPELDLTDIGDATEQSMSVLAEEFIKGINPITGKFYTSFSSKTWIPGGILLVPLSEQQSEAGQSVQRNIGLFNDAPTSEQVISNRKWKMLVWGESEGSILIEMEFYTR
ncbi:MAG: hypothetical protein R3F46_10080 [bacterium]